MWFIAIIVSLFCLLIMIVSAGIVNDKLDAVEDALRHFDMILRASDVEMFDEEDLNISSCDSQIKKSS